MDERRVDFNAILSESPVKGVQCRNHISRSRKIRLVEYARDFIEPDWCRKGHIGYVIEGEMEIDYHGTAVRYQTGDGIIIPSGEENRHKARILSEKAKVFLVEDE